MSLRPTVTFPIERSRLWKEGDHVADRPLRVTVEALSPDTKVAVLTREVADVVSVETPARRVCQGLSVGHRNSCVSPGFNATWNTSQQVTEAHDYDLVRASFELRRSYSVSIRARSPSLNEVLRTRTRVRIA